MVALTVELAAVAARFRSGELWSFAVCGFQLSGNIGRKSLNH